MHSVFEVNFSRVAQMREKKKAEFEQRGAQAHVHVVHHQGRGRRAARGAGRQRVGRRRQHRVYHKDINVGIAVRARLGADRPCHQERRREEPARPEPRSRRSRDARALKQLKPEEVQGGTFTITNPGVFGALFGMPIINQPQVAILGVGDDREASRRDRRCDRDPADGPT